MDQDSQHPSTKSYVDSLEEQVLRAPILVVDDMALMRQMIAMILKKAGFTNISFAENGVIALEQVKKVRPELVILDLKMPEMTGNEVCAHLRAAPETEDLPILVQSATEGQEERAELFQIGATDFINKPINQSEMVARVCHHIQNRLLIRDLSAYEREMRREMELAQDMQRSLLPSSAECEQLKKQYNIDLESHYQASLELGGDLWGVAPVDDNRFALFLLDVTGHGVASALNTFRIHATMRRLEADPGNPAEFLTALNAALQPTLPMGQFATMFYGVFDVEKSILTFAGAGSPRPLFVGDAGLRFLDTKGFPVGILPNPTYENREFAYSKGDQIFFYSDVMVEGEDADGSFLGEDGLMEMVLSARKHKDCSAFMKAMIDRYFARLVGPLNDDLTAVIVNLP